MRLKIPLTGTRIPSDPREIRGNPNNPISVINLDIGDIAWQAVSFDMENDLVEVEAEVPRRMMARLNSGQVDIIEQLVNNRQQQLLDALPSEQRESKAEEMLNKAGVEIRTQTVEEFVEPDIHYSPRAEGILNNAKHLLESHSIDELYQMSGSPRLKKPKPEEMHGEQREV